MTARGGGEGSRSVTGQPNGAERPYTRCNGGEGGVNFVEKKRYEIFERPQRVIVPQKFILTNISMNIP